MIERLMALRAGWLAALLAMSVVVGSGAVGFAQETEQPPPATEAEAEATDEAVAEEETAAQEAPPQRVSKYRLPAGSILSFDIPGYRATIDAAMTTAVGQLMNEPEMKTVIETVTKRYEAKTAAVEELIELAEDLDVEVDFETRISRLTEQIGDIEFEGISAHLYMPEKDDTSGPRLVGNMLFAEEDKEKVLKAIADFEELIRDADEIESSTEKKLGDVTVKLYGMNDGEDVFDAWYFIDEGELWLGVNTNELVDSIAKGEDPKRDETTKRLFDKGIPLGSMHVDVEAIITGWREQVDDEGDIDDMEMILEFLGIIDLKSVQAGVVADGLNFREKLLLEMTPTGTGLLAALRPISDEAAGKPPVIPAVEPELMHVRGSFDTQKILDAFLELRKNQKRDDFNEEKFEEAITKMRRVFDVFDGGMSFIIAGPAFGGMIPIPRLVFSFGITDVEKYKTALAEMKEEMEGIGFADREYKGVNITTIQIPNNPSPIVPAFAVVDNALFMAESPMTLRGLVTSIQEKKPSKGPQAPKDRRDALLCAYDSEQIFRLMYEKILPLAQLGIGQMQRMMGGGDEPILNLAELPRSDMIAKHLGGGEARITWVGDGIEMIAASPLGDPLTALIASISAPLVPMQMGFALDAQRSNWEEDVCRARVARISEALRLHRTTFGAGKRFPSSLGDLLSRGLIEDEDMFLVPSDDDPATVEYETEDGDIAEIAVSYKYLPNSKLEVDKKDLEKNEGATPLAQAMIDFEGLELDVEQIISGEKKEAEDTKTTIILYEMNRNKHGGRIVLTADGDVFHVGEDYFKKLVSMK